VAYRSALHVSLENSKCGSFEVTVSESAETVFTEWLKLFNYSVYDCISKSFRTGRLERELQMVPLSATRFSFTSILWVSL